MPTNYPRAFLRYHNLVVDKFRSTTRINLKWLSYLGTHWTKYGLMPPNDDSIGWIWRWRPLLGFMISFTYFVKTLVLLHYDTYNSPDLAIAYGDVFAFATATHASWTYCNLVHLMGYSYTASFHLQVALQKESDTENLLWLQVIELLKDGNYGKMMTENSGLKLLKSTSAISKFLSKTMPASLAIYGFLLSLPYFMSLPFDWHFLFGILHGFHYILFGVLIGQMMGIKAAYFLCFCLYISYSVGGICGKLDQAMNLYSHKHRWIGKYITRQIESITTCIELIRSCNRYFGEKLKPLLATMLSATLVYLYTIPTAAGASDFLFLGFGITFCCFNTVYFFTSASFVKRKLTHCYRALNLLQLTAKGFRIKWSVLLTLEMLASRKKRVGFEVKDWCKLNNWSLLKVIMISSSVYFLMIKFGQRL